MLWCTMVGCIMVGVLYGWSMLECYGVLWWDYCMVGVCYGGSMLECYGVLWWEYCKVRVLWCIMVGLL